MSKNKQIKKLRRRLDKDLRKEMARRGIPIEHFKDCQEEFDTFISLRSFKETVLELLLKLEMEGIKMAAVNGLRNQNGSKEEKVEA